MKRLLLFILLCFSVLIALIILPFKIGFTIACDYERQIKNFTLKK